VMFCEAAKSKKKGCGMTKMDAERMKRRMSWTLRLHSTGTYEKFRTAVTAVLEHHFNNHLFCADWCQAANGTEEEIRESGLRFRDKIRNKDLYLFLKGHHDQFMEDSKLRQLWHQYDTNNVEAFNKFLTKFLPKDRTLCQTIENKARSYLAVGLQSIGYRQFYGRLFELAGVPLQTDDITSLFLRSEDQDKLWRKLHRRKEGYKITRMRKQYKKLREGVEKLKSDNAKELSYESGMMGPAGAEEGEVQKKGPRRGPRRSQAKHPCPHCGSTTHSRKSSSLCPANPKNAKSATDTISTVGAVEPAGTRNISRL
jgi:ribosomal protein L37AE/L43A